MKRILLAAILVLGGVIGMQPQDASAQLVWRVSVKFILNASGNRPASGGINTDTEVQAQIDLANQILDAHGRGYRLQLTEIVDVSGVSGWYSAEINSANKSALELAAEAAPTTYAWRNNAINIYINGDDGSAICSFPPGEEIIFVGQNPRTTTFLHEIGHFMDCCHTQGCPCGSCAAGETGECNTIPGNDGIAETIPDLECWSQNQIAQWTYGLNYNALSASQQNKVDEVFNNIMSYHNTRNRLSPDQLDRMACASNGARSNESSGTTWFVGAQSGDEECLDINYLKPSYSTAIAAAGGGDIIMFRGSQYDYTGTTTKAVTLRTSRGSSILGTLAAAKLAMGDDEIDAPPPPELPDTDDGRTGP